MDIVNYPSFESATRSVLASLHQRLGFQLWMLTQLVDQNWIVLMTENHGYSVQEGNAYLWSDSCCARMVAGKGPRIAPRTKEIEAYRSAPIRQQFEIAAYISTPVRNSDGSLFGTLCAIDPKEQSDDIKDELPLVESYANLISMVLSTETQVLKQSQLLNTCYKNWTIDILTGLLNRNGWEQCLRTHEERIHRYSPPISVLMVDLDNLKQVNDSSGHSEGDKLLIRTAQCLQETLRKSDTVARIGGDEFAVLVLECNEDAADRVYDKITSAFKRAGILASVGHATRCEGNSLATVLHQADLNMYINKAARKNA